MLPPGEEAASFAGSGIAVGGQVGRRINSALDWYAFPKAMITHILQHPTALVYSPALKDRPLDHSWIAHYVSLFIPIHVPRDSIGSAPSGIGQARSSATFEDPSVHRYPRPSLSSLSGMRRIFSLLRGLSASRGADKRHSLRDKPWSNSLRPRAHCDWILYRTLRVYSTQ